ncbi:FimV/HubP family polar landmark protein [Undibacterium cyanobacteriorum]|uniref:FimV/HubP family polar landmark protein n=1 Tax=Undibacterium cyanobacteriorum TaxID=3073561 RepID=A0ABY9RKE6_9BURK|nr:FimV/HubP family polar landmark protein [Undibacterium sp. 20NA77.5]WMW81693.1 FimV/HubP family polar landmark protein [Undibacterium sp. 20NA77.5]
MKHTPPWLSATRLILTCILASLALSTSASGSGVGNAGNSHQDVDLRKDTYAGYDSNTTYEKSKFGEATQSNGGANPNTNARSPEQELKANQAQLRDALQKQMTTLLQENAEINRQRIQIMESGKQRLLWAQALVAIFVMSILAALAYFWHLHARNLVNRGMHAISNTLSNFQDSLLQFVDTSDLAAHSSVSSFALAQGPQDSNQQDIHKPDSSKLDMWKQEAKQEFRQEPSFVNQASQSNQTAPDIDTAERRRQALSAQRSTNISRDYFVEELEHYQLDQLDQHQASAPAKLEASKEAETSATTPTPVTPATKPDEFFAVKGYVDSWLRVYKPSEQAEDSIRLTPSDPLIELAKKESEKKPEKESEKKTEATAANDPAKAAEEVFRKVVETHTEQEDDSLAFDRDANKMQARSSSHKPLGYKLAKASTTNPSATIPQAMPTTPAASVAQTPNASLPQDTSIKEIEPFAMSKASDDDLVEAAKTYTPAPSKKKPSSPRELLSELDHCRANNDAEAYQRVYREIKKYFNLKLEPWEMPGAVEQKQLADFPHVINKILELWASDDIVAYLERLVGNSRINPRQGFDLAIFEKLEDLLTLARTADRPRDLQQLKKLDRAAFLFVPVSTPKVESFKAKESAPKSALQIDASLSYQHSERAKINHAKLEAMITPEFGALDDAMSATVNDGSNIATATTTSQDAVATNEMNIAPRLPEPSREARQIDADRNHGGQDDKFMLSPFEVRIKLAVAYTEMGDHEGAILLLEEVIQDAPLNQRKHAERLIREIEAKKSQQADHMISHAAQTTEPLVR